MASNSSIVSYLEHKLSEEIEGYTKQLATGAIPDFDTYRHQVGLIRGLQLAHSIVHGALEDIEREDVDA